MIQRRVLTDDFDFEKFDFFNDAEDTLRWLAGIGTARARDVHARLTEANDSFVAQRELVTRRTLERLAKHCDELQRRIEDETPQDWEDAEG